MGGVACREPRVCGPCVAHTGGSCHCETVQKEVLVDPGDPEPVIDLSDTLIRYYTSNPQTPSSQDVRGGDDSGSEGEGSDQRVSSIYVRCPGALNSGCRRVLHTRAREVPHVGTHGLQLVVENSGRIFDYYDVEQPITGGDFGSLRAASHKTTGAARAVREIRKNHTNVVGTQWLTRELRIARTLDHPNLLTLFEVFEDREAFYLVTEPCDGPDLSSLLQIAGRFSEDQSASIVRQLLQAVLHLHDRQVCHRDIRAESCLLMQSGGGERLKIRDFQHACYAPPGRVFRSRVGMLSHAAPEVLDGQYSCPCDLWSCGVVAYSLLCGELPFRGSSDEKLAEHIKSRPVSFSRGAWRKVNHSQLAVMCVHGLLMKDPAHRPSPREAVSDPWFDKVKPQRTAAAARTQVLPEEGALDGTLQSLQAFRKQSTLKRVAMHALLTTLPEQQIWRAKLAFAALDADGDGLVSQEDLAAEASAQLKPEPARKVTAAPPPADAYTFSEFLAGTLDLQFLFHICYWPIGAEEKTVFSAAEADAGTAAQGKPEATVWTLQERHLVERLTGGHIVDSPARVSGPADQRVITLKAMSSLHDGGMLDGDSSPD